MKTKNILETIMGSFFIWVIICGSLLIIVSWFEDIRLTNEEICLELYKGNGQIGVSEMAYNNCVNYLNKN